MTEKEIKFLCKWAIDNGNRPLSDAEKELAKKQLKNLSQLRN